MEVSWPAARFPLCQPCGIVVAMPIAWQTAQVDQVQEWAPGLRTLTLSTAPPISFEAGQFVNLALDLPDGRVSRNYSMASAPGDPLEFFLIEVQGGALTPALFALSPGDPLFVNPRPAGHFTLANVPPAEILWLIATGTGLGPYISMLRTDAAWEYDRLVLVHAVRQPEHLAYREELTTLSAAHDERLAVVSIVSRAPAEGALRGRVTVALQNGALEQAAGARIDPATSHVLLCGNPAMIGEMLALLSERGLKRHRRSDPGHVTSEKYWG